MQSEDEGSRLEANRRMWDERAPIHAASRFYDLDGFRSGRSSLQPFEVEELGPVAGLDLVHLQCHIGTDTISLSRLGASMTGLDFSGPAVEAATRLAASTGADATFVQSDVYAAADVLGTSAFDLVYTGTGALCWLPDIRRWAQVVAALLRPGGRLFIREGHPMLWTIEERDDDLLAVKYPYFEQPEPLTWTEGGTYVDTDQVFEQKISHEWNHGIGEIVTALLDAGLALTGLVEHDSVAWNAFPGKMDRIAGNEWRLADRPARLAHSYTIQAVKPRQ